MSMTLGAICSVLVGCTYIAYGIVYLYDPCNRSTSAHAFMDLFRSKQSPYLLRTAILAMGSAAAVAVVPAVSGKFHQAESEWVRFVSTLAIIGFVALSISSSRTLQILPVIFRDWVDADTSTKISLARQTSLIALDPRGWFTFGGVALWLLTVNILALSYGTWSPILAGFGITSAILYLSMLITGLLHRYALFSAIIMVGGLVVAPVWYIWMGLFIL